MRDRIQSGAYREGEWLPPERALAAEFHVSRILIRSAVKELERHHFISRSVHHRPLIRGGSTPSRAAVGASASRSLALWIWPRPNWPASSMTIQGVQEAMGDEFRLVLGTATGDSGRELYASEARFLRQIHRDRDIEGVIISYMGGTTNRPYLEDLRAAAVPMVFLDHLPPAGFEGDYVGVNNKWAAEQVVRHLLALGHRHIAHVSSFDEISTVAERRDGYRQALQSAGIAFRPELVEKDPGPSGSDPEQGCEELIARLLALPDPPTAIFALHDITAFRVIAALRKQGRRVPEEMSVAGFDGIERWMPSAPFLTSAYQPFEEIGAQAVDLLRERLRTGPRPVYKHVLLDARLAAHRSTQPPHRAVGNSRLAGAHRTE